MVVGALAGARAERPSSAPGLVPLAAQPVDELVAIVPQLQQLAVEPDHHARKAVEVRLRALAAPHPVLLLPQLLVRDGVANDILPHDPHLVVHVRAEDDAQPGATTQLANPLLGQLAVIDAEAVAAPLARPAHPQLKVKRPAAQRTLGERVVREVRRPELVPRPVALRTPDRTP